MSMHKFDQGSEVIKPGKNLASELSLAERICAVSSEGRSISFYRLQYGTIRERS